MCSDAAGVRVHRGAEAAATRWRWRPAHTCLPHSVDSRVGKVPTGAAGGWHGGSA